MPQSDAKRIRTKQEAEARIAELHRTVIRPIDLLGITPKGSVRRPGDTARQDQALSEIADLKQRFGITSSRRPKKGR